MSHLLCSSRSWSKPILYGVASLLSSAFAFHHATTPIHLDAPRITRDDVLGKLLPDHTLCIPPQPGPTLVDPATSIEFPKELRVPSRFPLPPHSLLGVGARAVSFLGINVYSVGFYADLTNPKLRVCSSALAWTMILTRQHAAADSYQCYTRGESQLYSPKHFLRAPHR